LISVNHLEGHALMPRMVTNIGDQKPDFPFLLLLVSGGHSQLLLCKGIGDYVQLGGTLDDSLGEVFDKVARLLGNQDDLHGGPFIEHLAKLGDPTSVPFSISMQHRKNCDFSFSGFKAAAARYVEQKLKEEGSLTEILKANIAASFQHVILASVMKKTATAIDWCSSNLEQPLTGIVSDLLIT
jgi:N6-L-threonylcarbamoyladenine synthase